MLRTTGILLATWVVGCGGATADPHRTSAAPGPWSGDTAPPPREDGRLPPGVRPSRYVLDLAVDPAKPTFTGHVRIAVTIDHPTRNIVLHGRGLAIHRSAIATPRGTLVGKARLRTAFDSIEPEELVLSYNDEVPAGQAELDFEYEAPFAEGLVGLYRLNDRGASYAFTQFEATDARRAFPCFDEPGYKTPFELRLDVPEGAIAVANMPEARRTPRSDGKVIFEFAPSPPLPTYLVALAVGPLELREGPRTPVPLRLVTARGKTSLGDLAIEASARHLELLGKYFDRPYPYPKLDVVAVPNFAYGAMENAGLVTFREQYLLTDSKGASTFGRRLISGAVAHELAHQWFGDLVTMQWWDDTWLNEAFASWMEDKVVDQWQPSSHARLRAIGDKKEAMDVDTLPSAPKIRTPIRSAGDLEAMDPAIVYDKGKAVLTMVERWLGEDVFREGLRLYMRKHAWGTVTAADLYADLAEASGGRNVREVMESFTDQSGVPSLEAKLVCPPDAAPTLRLRQHEYRSLDRDGASQKLWRIPVCATYEAGREVQTACTLLGSAEGTLDLPQGSRCPSFVYANQAEGGYYRVSIDRADLEKLAGTALGSLGEGERFGVVSNAWAQVHSGELTLAAYLGLLSRFKKETSLLVWNQIFDSLDEVDNGLISEGARPAFAKLVRDLLSPLARQVGWNARKDEPEDDKLLRGAALLEKGRVGGDSETSGRALRLATAWLSEPAAIDADMARMAVQVAAKNGDGGLFERLVTVLRSAESPDVLAIALFGLASFDNPALIDRALALTLDGTIKKQDIGRFFTKLAQRRATRDALFAWFEKHAEELVKSAPPFALSDLRRLAERSCETNRVHEIAAFLASRLRSVDGFPRNLAKSVEQGLRCAALAAKERAPTEKWLRAAN